MATALPDPSKIDLRERKSREKLAKLGATLLEHWQPAPLAGLWCARPRGGEPLGASSDLIARAGHLLGIHKALRILFPHDRDLAYRWVATPNRRFDGRAPLEVMKQALEGALAARRYT